MNIDVNVEEKHPQAEKSEKKSKVVEITDDNFQRTVNESPLPVLIDFWAAWCAPCRTMAPHVEALAEAYAGRARVGKLDADTHQDIVAKLDVRSLPTFLVVKQGKVVGQIVGAVPKSRLEALLEKSLA